MNKLRCVHALSLLSTLLLQAWPVGAALPGSIRIVAASGDVAPGLDGQTSFTVLGGVRFTADGRDLVYGGVLTGPKIDTDHNGGLWQGSQVLARNGDVRRARGARVSPTRPAWRPAPPAGWPASARPKSTPPPAPGWTGWKPTVGSSCCRWPRWARPQWRRWRSTWPAVRYRGLPPGWCSATAATRFLPSRVWPRCSTKAGSTSAAATGPTRWPHGPTKRRPRCRRGWPAWGAAAWPAAAAGCGAGRAAGAGHAPRVNTVNTPV